jgi:exopolyphosphatase/guanosine-5'-triphosphate,3'-diphosphate pyrophosphatase
VKVAIIDLGTNTCRLFLAGVTGGRVEQAARLTTVVRLGQGVDETGQLHADAVARTHACISGYAPRIEAYCPERSLLVATSVLRDARDGRQFLVALKYDFGLPWRILSGQEEGTLAFRGGTSWLAGGAGDAAPPAAAPTAAMQAAATQLVVPDPLLLVDIGGGSTEFAVGSAGEPPAFVRSLDVGVVRLTERFFHHDPPEAAEVAALTGHVAAAIADAVPAELRAAVRGAVGVAGTYTTLVANKLGMTEYDGRLVQGHVLSLAEIDATAARFARLTSAERGRLPGIQPGREDVILAGTLIAGEACRAFGLDAVRVSEADLLEGASLALADGSLKPR